MWSKGFEVNRHTLPSWKIQRKCSFSDFLIASDFVEDWLEEERRQQHNKIIDFAIYSRYQVPELFADLPKTKSSHAHMGKWEKDIQREETFIGHCTCNGLVNGKLKRSSPIRIPVPNDLYKLRYRHRHLN